MNPSVLGRRLQWALPLWGSVGGGDIPSELAAEPHTTPVPRSLSWGPSLLRQSLREEPIDGRMESFMGFIMMIG